MDKQLNMDLKDYLTNEKVCKKFGSQFELVNYAIRLAANMIHTGRDSRVKIDSQNRAMQVLGEILNDKDVFDDILETNENDYSNNHQNLYEAPIAASKAPERKKGRKILDD